MLTNVKLNKELAWKINVEGTEQHSQRKQSKSTLFSCLHFHRLRIQRRKRRIQRNGYARLQSTITDSPNSKLKKYVKNTANEYCIARPSVIYGANPAAGKINFALWLLNKLKSREPVRIVTDQWNSPTLNTSLAEMTLEIIERKLTGIFTISQEPRA